MDNKSKKPLQKVSNIVMSVDYGITRAMNALAVIAALCLIVVMLMAVIDVIGSKLFNRSLAMAYEVTEMLSIPIVFLAIGSVVFGRGPMRVDLLMNKLNPKMQTVLIFIGDLIGIAVSAIVASRAWSYTFQLFKIHSRTSGAVQILKWPFALILCIGWITVGLGCLFRMLRPILKYEGPPDLSPDESLRQHEGSAIVPTEGGKQE